MRKYKPSTVETLEVVRKAEFGVFLAGGTASSQDDILLHSNQMTAHVEVGDFVKVFLYLDPNRKLAASQRVPQMKEGQIARVKVINTTKDGAFLDVKAERGIFLPFQGMRGRVQVGEVVWAKLYTDKSGRLAMTMEVDDEIRRASKKAENVKKGDILTGAVYNITDKGVFVFTDDRYIAFIVHKEVGKRPKVGERVSLRVTYLRDDGRLNGSFRLIKEKAQVDDAERILEHLRTHGGKMPYADTTHPDIIMKQFNISKAAFKRALGHLLKAGLIYQQDGFTFLTAGETE